MPEMAHIGESSPGESHPEALAEPSMRLLPHSAQANTPVILICQCIKRSTHSVASRCRNWLAWTLCRLKRLNLRIAHATSV
jgi:hypothetical protein